MDRIACPTCGEEHDLSDMQVGFDKPDAWFAVDSQEREARIALTPDVAVIDAEHHFVRGVLEIPVHGEPQPFGWGIWVTVSRADFARVTDEGDAASRDPFPGRIASQLAGYPQTLGLVVNVRPSGDGLRPLFDVLDAVHPLSREQQHGIPVERALEHLSRYLHAGEPEPKGEPWVASIAADGWQLDDALARFHARDGVYWLPKAEDRESVRTGDLAKVIFAIEASDETGAPDVHRERMWVEVDAVRGGDPHALVTGILTNGPHVPGTTRAGMRVWFRPQHVVDVARGEAQLSDAHDVLRCARHGVSQTTYVCQHLSRGSGLGFNRAEDLKNPRPDAWCDGCESVLLKEGEWNDRSEAAAGVTVICAGCYDAAEERNRAR